MKDYLAQAKELVEKMTLEEKCSLLSGTGFWWTKEIERLELPDIMMSDGPHGLRKQMVRSGNETIDKSETSVCFPTASASACSFDRELLTELGKRIGEEAKDQNVSIVLGPGVNMKRSPLCGRNFEYFSEDPYLAGEMGASWIKGVRSQDVSCSLKHFLANNQEYSRMCTSSEVDERALREIYMPAFERAVMEKPQTVMCSYNCINGVRGSENDWSINQVLRKEWGFDGIVVTDWGAVADRVTGLKAGVDLEMPSSDGYRDKQLERAVMHGELSEEVVNQSAVRMTRLILMSLDKLDRNYSSSYEEHHAFAVRAAEESMVLLKNEGILPLQKNDSLAVIGEFAEKPRYQGAGSSMISSYKVDSFLSALDRDNITYSYAKGYDLDSTKVDDGLIEEAVELAKMSKKVVVFVGLPNIYESEGYDRTNIDLPVSHNKLMEALLKQNKNVVVLLVSGSPVALPWRDKVKAILDCYLAGEGSGEAAKRLVFGEANPSGKLAETFPLALSDVPSTRFFPCDSIAVPYVESMFIGYRYFDSAREQVAYPFGHGISYTSYSYSNLVCEHLSDGVKVSFDLENTGLYDGKEVAEVYVSKRGTDIIRAEQALFGFEKVALKSGEKKNVQIFLSRRAFSYWNDETNAWAVEGGEYEIRVGASSRDIRLTETVEMDEVGKQRVYDKEALAVYFEPKKLLEATESDLARLRGREIVRRPLKPFTDRSSMRELAQGSLIGKLILKIAVKASVSSNESKNDAINKMVSEGAKDMIISSVPAMTGNMLSFRQCEGILDMANGKFFKGLNKLITKEKKR